MENGSNADKKVALWLFLCCLMVAVMIAIGGLTRLTESGLSMTNWHPVNGIFPPISSEEWQKEFNNYKTTPEFKKKNFDINLDGFKKIFWLEYIHRIVGRIAGIVFFAPFIYFVFVKYIQKPMIIRLSAIFLLGGIQGIIGWTMVKSGMVNDPFVSPSWLALHLGMAFIIYSFLFWTALDFFTHKTSHYVKKTASLPYKTCMFALILLILILCQVVIGGYVAGTDAGLVYNSFPDMNGQYIPDGMFILTPVYKNFLQNPTLIQFIHRIMAYLILAFVLLLWLQAKKFEINENVNIKIAANLLVVTCIVQLCLGIYTLLTMVAIPIALTHQIVALVLHTINLYIVYYCFYEVM